ncbi:site-2 protease family protein [Candidatus Pacearchaeota archaeon]|jgi:Zn-dependent protease|nr:site-2 protease family protein [Candidatus Pacearchaeota archaeon]|tara:strand:+ start:2566 stop:3162 length:597 start_codon:yes stop_codon:yes gene_type:complete
MRFTNRETKDLFFAWIMISLAFAILFSGIGSLFSNPILFITSLGIALFTAGIGFLLHELMHKYVAQNYGFHAEFKAFYNMLFLAIAFSFFGFILAAPGAVFISGFITREKNGKISLAGPMTNILLAIIFLILLLIFTTNGILGLFLNYGLMINSLLALFNMIPFMPFDGKKVYDWNKVAYFITVILALVLFLSRYLII